MINLLPPDNKHELRAARINRLLLRYSIMSFIVMLFLVILTVGGHILLNEVEKSTLDMISVQESDLTSLSEQKEKVDKFKADLSTSKELLAEQSKYSIVLVRFGEVLPEGTYISTLSISDEFFDTPMTLNVTAKDTPTALKVKTALEESPYFTNVSFDSISEAPSTAIDPNTNQPVDGADNTSAYTTTATLTLTVKKEIQEHE